MEDVEEIAQRLKEQGDVMTVFMKDLRDACGYGKLGTWVVEDIKNKLAGEGICHIPRELPPYQDRLVRLYRAGTPVAGIIEAVAKPGEEEDEIIKEYAAKESQALLNKIRAWVCENQKAKGRR